MLPLQKLPFHVTEVFCVPLQKNLHTHTHTHTPHTHTLQKLVGLFNMSLQHTNTLTNVVKIEKE
jgi:hypothetical protein